MNILNKTISKSALRHKKLLENIPKGITLNKFSQKNIFHKINTTCIKFNLDNKEKGINTFNKIKKFNFSESKKIIKIIIKKI